MPLHETREHRADLTSRTGRVRAWTTEKEAGYISIAVPNDRCQMTPADARALAAWLSARAAEAETPRRRSTGLTEAVTGRRPVWS
ncbi:hypothetical protein SAMN05428940_4630 [Streptomyces sp. 2133.1]|nr:hypothetical protein BX261_4602 [Streptomyces sp. 2321.6]SED37732.1 hypothetical protein SAMN05428940_4630 [Streptomyces sp. 2133.1]